MSIYKGNNLISGHQVLYSTTGQNTDGAMTQKAVSDITENTRFDGQWVNNSLTLASSVTALTTSSTSYDLSSYLPNDNYNYEVLFTMNGQTKAAANSYSYGILSTDIITSNCYVFIARTAMNTTNAIQGGGSIILPVGTGRTVTVGYNSKNSGNYSLNAVGYRRIGTNA